MKNAIFGLCLILLVFSLGCENNPTIQNDTTSTRLDSETQEVISQKKVQNSSTNILIYPFEKTQNYPAAKLEKMDYKDGAFNFTVNDYELGAQTPDANVVMCANSDQGQHIHVIINNEPYLARYKPNFGHTLQDGTYTVLAFLGKSYHESIKTPQASILENITVNNGSIVIREKMKSPAIFYSRPKGTYIGKDAKKILLDFYPTNVSLDKDHQVRVEIDGTMVAQLSKWQSYALEGLAMGEHTITLTLVNSTGNLIDGPFSTVSRTITLKADPANSM